MVTAPGISHWIPLPFGSLKQFLRDPLNYLVRAQQKYGDVFRFRSGPMILHFLFHPDHVRRIFHEKQKNYLRGWHYQLLRRLLGNNLVVSEGDYWLRQRRLAQPAFHRQRFAGYANTMIESTSQMLVRWQELASVGKAIDIGWEMSRVTLAIAGKTLFSRDVSQDADAVGSGMGIFRGYLEQRFNHPFTSLPLWAPTPTNLRFKRVVKNLNRIVLEMIQDRRKMGGEHPDLLSMLMQARDEETGEVMTDDQIRSEVLTFFMAGHETTATSLTWTWYALATHPEIREQVRREIQTVISNRLPSIEDIPQLHFTRMVIEESLRLYPPVWLVSRQVVEEDEIDGYRLPRGSTVLLSPYITQRHTQFWDRPQEFDPYRFGSENSIQRNKYAYFPFISGPHQCIGNEFALLEMRLMVAMILQRFDLELLPNQTIYPVGALALRPNNPIWMQLK